MKSVIRIVMMCTFVTTLFLTACQVSTPWGTVEPADPPARVSENCIPQKVGERHYEGKTYWLIDNDCDGKPDFALDPEKGQYFRLTGNQDPHLYTSVSDSVEDLLDMHGALETPGFREPFAVDLRAKTAQEWLATYDLLSSRSIASEAKTSFALYELGVDTETHALDVIIPWSSDYEIPAPFDYDISFEMFGVENDSGPTFYMIHLAGDGVEVATFLHDLFQSNELTVTAVFDGDLWTLASDMRTGVAVLSQGDEEVNTWEF